MNLLRSITSVIAGLGFILTGSMIGTGLLGALLLAAGFGGARVGVSLVVSALVAILGGWLTARIAGHAEMAHAGLLAALFAAGTVLAVTSAAAQRQPRWYGLTVGAIGIAGILVGGRLRSAAAQASRGSAAPVP